MNNPSAEQILAEILEEFKTEAEKIFAFEIKCGDAQKPLAYIATKCFSAELEEYQKWLTSQHSSLGTLTPIMILAKDRDSWVVKDALMKLWLKKCGLLVIAPRTELKYRKVTFPGGFTSWRPIEEAQQGLGS